MKKILRCTDECRILCIAGSTSPLLLTAFLKGVGAEEIHLVKKRKKYVYSAILDHGKVSIVYKGGISPMGRGDKLSKNERSYKVLAELPDECSVTYPTISPRGDVLLCPVSNCFSHLVCGNIIERSLLDILDSIPFMGHTPFYYVRNVLKGGHPFIKFLNQCDVCYRLDKGDLGISVNTFSHFFK